jgi:hypothetical protein
MKYSEKDSIASQNLIEIARLLKDKGYEVNGIEFSAPREQDGEIGIFYTVKVAMYVTSD